MMASWCIQESQIMVVGPGVPHQVRGLVVKGTGSGSLGSIRLVHLGALDCNSGVTCTCLWPQDVGPWLIPNDSVDPPKSEAGNFHSISYVDLGKRQI